MIRLENVSKVYPAGARPALDGVSFEIDKGEFVFLIGQSGSGKTTVLRLLLREEISDAGLVMVNGRNLNRMPGRKVPDLRRKIGCVFQDFRLLPKKTVYENVAFALEVINKSPKAIKRTVPEVLDLVGLQGKAQRMPNELTGGELGLCEEARGDRDAQPGDRRLEHHGELLEGEAWLSAKRIEPMRGEPFGPGVRARAMDEERRAAQILRLTELQRSHERGRGNGDDLSGGQAAFESEQSGHAKLAVHRAADLARDADRVSLTLRHQDGFDGAGIGQPQQIAPRPIGRFVTLSDFG